MTDNSRSRTWFTLAVAYFIVAVAMGIVMGASGDHSLMPVHAHLNLLGWVTMALYGLIGLAYPAVFDGRVATLQLWLYNVGVPVMLGALAWRIKGHPAAEPVVGLASIVVGIAVLLFAWQMLRHVVPGRRAPQGRHV